MNAGSFTYLVGHGFASLWLNRLMTLASIVILTACLILTGGAGLLTVSVRSLLNEIEGNNQMAVYVEMDATDEEIDILKQQIAAIEEVESFIFYSKEEVYRQQLISLGENSDLFEGLNPDEVFPATFSVTLNDISATARVSWEIKQLDNVYGINAAVEVADTLSGIEKAFIIVGVIMVAVLLIASMLVIGNTIKLSVYARRREINIMRYVGATYSFIRLPFVVEGVFIGLFSGALAFGALWGIYRGMTNMMISSEVSWIREISANLTEFNAIWYWLLIGFIGSGILIGAISSSGSVRKYVDV